MKTKEVKHIAGDGQQRTFVRLFADEGKVLTNDNGKTVWSCVDVPSADGWAEIDAPSEENETEPATDPDEATVSDYEQALSDLGVNLNEES